MPGAPAPFHDAIADAPPGGSATWIDTPDGQRLRVAIWPGRARGTVLIFPGRTEYCEKYGRVIGQLTQWGFCVLVIDWRGQGLSTRPLGTTDYGHVESFADYQTDLTTILAHPVAADLPRPHVLLAHSMGGCIGLRALHNGLKVSAAIFSAPMWRLGLGPLAFPFASVLTWLSCRIGLGLRHPPGTGSDHYIATHPYEGNVLTNDPDTYAFLHRQLTQHPELGLGGPSMRWVREAMTECAALMAMPPPMPVLTLLGDEEQVVDPGAIHRQMAKPGAGKLVICKGAQHEILMERPDVQAPAWAAINSWLADQGI